MNIEEEIFKLAKVNIDKLLKYGFKKQNSDYTFNTKLTDEFDVIITINRNSKVMGKIIDNEFNEEYLNYRFKEQNGEFVNKIRNKYKDLLIDILNNCFDIKEYMLDQSNRINNYIKNKYNSICEHLWESAPNYGVYRNNSNNKWFGIIMNINQSKLDKNVNKETEILNVKLDDKIKDYIDKKGIYPSYHMNKKYWISIILDDTLSDNEIYELIDISYGLCNNNGKRV